jgi:hypothetical protein
MPVHDTAFEGEGYNCMGMIAIDVVPDVFAVP